MDAKEILRKGPLPLALIAGLAGGVVLDRSVGQYSKAKHYYTFRSEVVCPPGTSPTVTQSQILSSQGLVEVECFKSPGDTVAPISDDEVYDTSKHSPSSTSSGILDIIHTKPGDDYTNWVGDMPFNTLELFNGGEVVDASFEKP